MADSTDDRLRLLIERIERLEEEKKGITEDIRDVYAEAKALGYDPKIMRKVVQLRKMDAKDRAEMELLIETYKAAIGLEGTPLGDWRRTANAADADGIGISMSVNGGPEIPLNKTAAKTLQAAE